MADVGDLADYRLSFSHVGFFVADMEAMVDFYAYTLGFFVTDRGLLAGKRITFLSRDPTEHHQIVLVDGRAPDSHQNINQISFRVGSLTELKAFYARLVAADAKGMEPVIHGNAWSVYFHDLEGNRLEVFADTDWYISQPIKEPLDLALPEDQIRAHTRDYCATRAGFRPIETWRKEMRDLMAAGLPVRPAAG